MRFVLDFSCNFNEINNHYEKWGGRSCPKHQIDKVSDMLSLCELRDLGFIGGPFTWCNNKKGEL